MVLAWLGSSAWAWPTVWTPVPQMGAPMTDPDTDRTLGDTALELHVGSDGAALAWHATTDEVFVRLPVLGDPSGLGGLDPLAWGVLVDTDGDLATVEAAMVAELAPGLLDLYLGDGTPGTQPGFGHWTYTAGWGSLATGEVRVVPDGGAFALDLTFARSEWADHLGIDPTSPFRLTAVTGPGIYLAWADVAACDGLVDACDDAQSTWSDVLDLDRDEDGLTSVEEGIAGLDPDDADQDDDGRIDGTEALADSDGDGALDPADCDSDDDGVLDGVEAGWDGVPEHEDTDLSSPCAQRDADPASFTDPTADDTDLGGLRDGQEDPNGDGAFTPPWETDPLDPQDDADMDGDGIADVIEAIAPDGEPDDVDSDSDGISDFVEGLLDSDGDGLPDFADVDSDGDCILDVDEGQGDPDGDGVGNWLDPDSDGDGIPDIEETGSDCLEAPADSDGDGVPDSQETDSDGDGNPDATEGFTSDVDCDGIVDGADADDTDGPCAEATTPGPTDPPTPTGPESLTPERIGEWTGGACNHGGVAMWPALLALGLLRRRRVAALAMLPTAAMAQDVDAERYDPGVDGGPTAMVEDLEVTDGAGVSAWLSSAHDPLVVRYGDGDETSKLSQVSSLDLGVSSGLFGRATVGLAVPIHTVAGEIDGAAFRLGDLRLDGKVRLAEASIGGVALRVGPRVRFVAPTSPEGGWTASVRPTLATAAVADLSSGPWLGAVNLGFRTGTGQELDGLGIGPALTWAAGGSWRPEDRWLAALELDGSWASGNPDQHGDAPSEWRAAAGAHMGDVWLIASGGTGLSQGVGAPDWRVGLGLQWHQAEEEDVVPHAPVVAATNEPVAEMGRVAVRALTPTGEPVPGADVRVLGTLGAPMRTGRDGVLEATLAPGPYEVTVSAAQFAATMVRFDLAADAIVDLPVVLQPVAPVVVDREMGRIFLNKKVFFEVDRAELAVESLTTLDALTAVLLANPDLQRIRVEGHTDSTGTDRHNLLLSRQRAQAVVDYLSANGVERKRLEAVGFGESRPLQNGDSEAVLATNRRVEFHLVDGRQTER